MKCFIHSLQNILIPASLFPKEAFFQMMKAPLTQRKKEKNIKKKALSLLYLPAVRFNVLPEAFSLLPVLLAHHFPLAPFSHSPSIRLILPSPTCRKFALVARHGIKALLSACSCQAPRPLLAGIQLSGAERGKRGRKSLTSHMVPGSAAASPLHGQMANS